MSTSEPFPLPPLLDRVPLRGLRPGDITVVIQGPYNPGLTEQGVRSVARILPGAKIVLSTWEGTVLPPALREAVAAVLYNADPGGMEIAGLVTAEQQAFHALKVCNINRHLCSSLAGLRRVDTPYAMKLRSDMALVHDDFLKYFELFATCRGADQVTRSKVVTGAAWSPMRSFSLTVQDFVWFGRSDDLLDIFDIKPLPSKCDLSKFGKSARDRTLLIAEQYILREFLEKYRHVPLEDCRHISPFLVDFSKRLISSNFICVPSYRYGVQFFRHLAHINRKQRFTWNWIYDASFTEWLAWARKTHATLPALPEPLAGLTAEEEAETSLKDGLVKAMPDRDARYGKFERIEVRALLEAGVARFEAGDAAEAFQAFRLANGVDPGDPDGCNLYGTLLSRAGQHDEAIEILTRAIRLVPGNDSFESNLKNALSRAGCPVGELEARVASLRGASASHPQ